MLARLRSYARNLRRRDAFEDAMDEEMRFHLESRAADLVRRGLSAAEAARRARLEFGSIEKQKDIARANVGIRLVDELRGDVRYALRTFVRNKSFAITAVVTLALGIGANAAIFNLIDALVLRWLPVRHPEQLLQILKAGPAGPPDDGYSYPMVRALADQTDFVTAAGFAAANLTIGTGSGVRRAHGAYVTGAFYETLGLTPAAGRLLTRADDQVGAPPVAVASYDFWQRQLGGTLAAIGQPLPIRGVPVVIAGVSPPGFAGAIVGTVADLTIPVAVLPQIVPRSDPLLGPGNSWLRVLARPRAGMTAAEAGARLAAVWPHITAQSIDASWSPARKASVTETKPMLVPGGTGWTVLRGIYVKPLHVLMGMVVLVLLVACANVASLLLARSSARQREIAVRLAIGATRARLLRQLLVESVLLSMAAAAVALFLSRVIGRVIVSLITTSRTAVLFELTPSWHVFAFTGAVALATAVLFGIAPALQATRTDPAPALKHDARTATSKSRLLPGLVSAQMALSLVLVIGAVLFVRTLRNLHTIDPGFRADRVLIVALDQNGPPVPLSLLDQVRQLAGVTSASISTHTPLSGARWSEPALPAGQPLPERDTSLFVAVSPGFFDTLRLPILGGRAFTEADVRQSVPVAIVNEAYARRYFPNRNPIGQRLSAVVRSEKRELEIVGLAGNANTTSLRGAPPLTIYVPYAQLTGNVPTQLEIHTTGPTGDLTASLQRLFQPLLPNAPIEVDSLATQVEGSLLQERMMASLAGGFGLLALALAAVCIYGLLAYSVARRTREIGLRMALGATRRGVVGLVLAGTRLPLLIGIAAGAPAAWIASRSFESMLFGLKATNVAAIGSAALVLVAVAQLAAYLPARRAARVDPLVALRSE